MIQSQDSLNWSHLEAAIQKKNMYDLKVGVLTSKNLGSLLKNTVPYTYREEPDQS